MALKPGCLKPEGLRCEYRENPVGIDERSPRLSWRLEAQQEAARGLRQKAYQVLVASSREALDQDRGDLLKTCNNSKVDMLTRVLQEVLKSDLATRVYWPGNEIHVVVNGFNVFVRGQMTAGTFNG